jgi:hypothetical protein
VVVFDVRLWHAGQVSTLGERAVHRFFCKVGPFLGVDPEAGLARTRSFIRTLRRTPDRMGIFLTFGPRHPWTTLYQRAGWHRHGPYPCALAPQIARKLSAHDIVLMRPA